MKTLTKTAIGLSAAGALYLLIQRCRNETSVEDPQRVQIHGYVSSGYEAVRDAFAGNFFRRRELGAACCVYHKGERVVDRISGGGETGFLHHLKNVDHFRGEAGAGKSIEPQVLLITFR